MIRTYRLSVEVTEDDSDPRAGVEDHHAEHMAEAWRESDDEFTFEVVEDSGRAEDLTPPPEHEFAKRLAAITGRNVESELVSKIIEAAKETIL